MGLANAWFMPKLLTRWHLSRKRSRGHLLDFSIWDASHSIRIPSLLQEGGQFPGKIPQINYSLSAMQHALVISHHAFSWDVPCRPVFCCPLTPHCYPLPPLDQIAHSAENNAAVIIYNSWHCLWFWDKNVAHVLNQQNETISFIWSPNQFSFIAKTEEVAVMNFLLHWNSKDWYKTELIEQIPCLEENPSL